MNALSRLVFRGTCALAARLYPRPAFEGLEHLPEEPCVIVGNHAQMCGPIYAELYLPGRPFIWCTAEMMHLSEVPAYAFQDFWSRKPPAVRWFYRLLSYAIAPLSVCVFNNARCIGVYRDARVINTMRQTLERLRQGGRIVIFPEHDVPHSAVLWDFQDGFVDLGRLYHRQTGRRLPFVPAYFTPALRRVAFGSPVLHDPSAPPADERRRVCGALMDAVTALALAQPRHRVVPYPNVPKRDYPYNIPDEVARK